MTQSYSILFLHQRQAISPGYSRIDYEDSTFPIQYILLPNSPLLFHDATQQHEVESRLNSPPLSINQGMFGPPSIDFRGQMQINIRAGQKTRRSIESFEAHAAFPSLTSTFPYVGGPLVGQPTQACSLKPLLPHENLRIPNLCCLRGLLESRNSQGLLSGWGTFHEMRRLRN